MQDCRGPTRIKHSFLSLKVTGVKKAPEVAFEKKRRGVKGGTKGERASKKCQRLGENYEYRRRVPLLHRWGNMKVNLVVGAFSERREYDR